MIDINSTIYTSIKDAFGKLRYQAKDDVKTFKDIMRLVLINDMLEWAAGLGEPESVLQKLVDMRYELIKCNSAFNVQYADTLSAYVNVNTPQSGDTWKRVWDSQTSTVFPEDKIFTGGSLYSKVDNLIIDNTIIP